MAIKRLSRKRVNPSSAVYTGVQHSETIGIQLFTYNKADLVEDNSFPVDDFVGFPKDTHQYWLNTHGIHEVEKIQRICSQTGIHSLTVQDILDVNQRPKFQEYDQYYSFSLKSILPTEDLDFQTEHISFILGRNFLLSFQEKKADYFNHVRERIRNNIGIVRERGTDYLLFLLLESILDNYLKTVSNIEAQYEEHCTFNIDHDPSPSSLKMIELYKRQVHQLKKTIIPIRDFVTRIEREEFELIEKRHLKYYYELKDFCLSLIDDCEQMEVRLEGSINLFFSIQGHRMNQVMKTLTIVATIFIPLTFIAGIYGMNFSNMPELGWKWGYFAIWGFMLFVFLLMLVYFRRKKWF